MRRFYRTHSRIILPGLLSLGFVLACEAVPPPATTPPAAEVDRKGEDGRLVIIGGALKSDNTEVYQAVLDGRWGPGPLCVLPTASGEPENTMEGYVAVFDSLGGAGTAEGIFLTVENGAEARSEEMVARIRACSGFFFTGGSQSRVTEVFRPDGQVTPAFTALWERFKAGAVVSGSSAGAAIMTDPMISGGSSAGALAEGARGGEGDGDGEGVWLERGLGFLPGALVDQHFLARGRWARLVVAVLAADEPPFGFGIDENTALVVEGGLARVAGESGVVFLDARDASPEADGNGGYGVILHLLGRGDVVDLSSGEVIREPTKNLLSEGGGIFGHPDADLFAPWILLEVLHEFGLAPDPRLTFRQDGFFLEFRKAPGFQLMAWDQVGFRGMPLGLSMGPFVLSVSRE